MTEKTKQLIAQVEKELEALPEDEQEEIGEELLNTLRRRTQERREDEAVAHPSLNVLQNAQIEGLPSDYSEWLDHYLYGTDEEWPLLDASFAIALVSTRDEHHDDAVRAAEQYGAHPYVTTRPVPLEIGNALSDVGHRDVAASYLETIERDSSTEIVPLSTTLFRRGFALCRERPDKTWGLTDCISFVVMRDRDIRAALTADTDFEQAGFRALLGE